MPTSSIDLAFLAAKKRQNPRTGFVHLNELIPVYENICYAWTLFTKKTIESVQEAKLLLERLIAFQSFEGNFPIYLHEFPQCYDSNLGLKIAPFFMRILRDFSHVLGAESKAHLESSLHKILQFYVGRELPPLWRVRYEVCQGRIPFEPLEPLSSSEWWEYFVSQQFFQTPICSFYQSGLQIITPFVALQDGFEPSPQLLEWMCAGKMGPLSSRLLKDHPLQIQLAALETIEVEENHSFSIFLQKQPFRMLWQDETLHSICLETKGTVTLETATLAGREMQDFDSESLTMGDDHSQKVKESPTVTGSGSKSCVSLPAPIAVSRGNELGSFLKIELPPVIELNRYDLFEVSFFFDATQNVDFTIQGRKGTIFFLGDEVVFTTPSLSVSFVFTLLQGEGDFAGHIFRSNRSNQIANTDLSAFDWKIALRTLRRSPHCEIGVRIMQ